MDRSDQAVAKPKVGVVQSAAVTKIEPESGAGIRPVGAAILVAESSDIADCAAGNKSAHCSPKIEVRYVEFVFQGRNP